jgi:hypothetical protein
MLCGSTGRVPLLTSIMIINALLHSSNGCLPVHMNRKTMAMLKTSHNVGSYRRPSDNAISGGMYLYREGVSIERSFDTSRGATFLMTRREAQGPLLLTPVFRPCLGLA